MKKNVGIVSCYFKKNYGSMLQAYATQKILDDFNINNETINIKLLNKEISANKRKYYLGQIFNFSFIKAKFGMIKLKLDCKINRQLGLNINIRNKKFEEFENRFNMSKEYNTINQLSHECGKYTDVLVGSDQLWLPVNVIGDYYTLNFVPENTNKIAYATSFGISHIPKKYHEKYREFLSRINHISTREQAGKDIINELINKDVQVVCDPTLLFDKEEWMSIQEKDKAVKEKYILCYLLGNSVEHRKFAERLRGKTGYKIVSLNHLDEYVKYSDKFADETPYDIGPSEFIDLIRNAEYICTDSFHGVIFSIINNKEFFVFRRYSNNKKVSTNSRLDSLLTIVDLKDRLIYGTEDINKETEKTIDYAHVNVKVECLREQSKEFLKKSLNI